MDHTRRLSICHHLGNGLIELNCLYPCAKTACFCQTTNSTSRCEHDDAMMHRSTSSSIESSKRSKSLGMLRLSSSPDVYEHCHDILGRFRRIMESSRNDITWLPQTLVCSIMWIPHISHSTCVWQAGRLSFEAKALPPANGWFWYLALSPILHHRMDDQYAIDEVTPFSATINGTPSWVRRRRVTRILLESANAESGVVHVDTVVPTLLSARAFQSA